LPAAWDVSLDTFGWDQVAREVGRRGLVDRPGTFLFTSKWYHSGHLAFAVGNRVPVLCYSPRDPRGFAQWTAPGRWVGHDGILVVIDRPSTEPAMYDRWFERIDPIGRFDVVRGGVAVREVRLFRCVRQVRPFPDDGPGGDRLAAVGRPAEAARRR
jgi:hypothetical protein